MLEHQILEAILLYKPLAYVLVLIGLLLEGELVLFSALILANQGYLSYYILLPLSVFGILTGDLLWFYLGVYFNGNSGKISRYVVKAQKLLQFSMFKTIFRAVFISKFTYGLHRAMLIAVGSSGVSVKKFLKSDSVAVAIWLSIIFLVSFLTSFSIKAFNGYVRGVEVLILIVIILWVVFQKIMSYIFLSKEKTAIANINNPDNKS